MTVVYHGVNRIPPEADPARLIVSPDMLVSHIKWLRARGYGFETASALAKREAPEPKIAVITFDDGWRDALEVGPLLAGLGVTPTFFVCPGWWGGHHPDVPGPAGRLLTRSETAELSAQGIDVGSHSMTHPDLRSLDAATLAEQLVASKAAIEDATGQECTTLAYPFGLYDDRVKDAARAAGYALAFAWLPGKWDPFAAPRLPGPPRHGARRLALKMLGVRRWGP